jgi:hypothetical protein
VFFCLHIWNLFYLHFYYVIMKLLPKTYKKKNKVIAKAVLLFVAFVLNLHLHLCAHIDMYI